MEEQTPERHLKRRAFLADIAGVGAVILGSAVWALSTRIVDASPNARPSAKGSKSPTGGKPASPVPAPPETDHVRLDGDVAPVSPSPKARSTGKPSPSPSKSAGCASPPREHDVVPLGGKPVAPPIPPKSPSPKPR